jgi:uncharacterized surface protein with fasciclin (FAS1) repeats
MFESVDKNKNGDLEEGEVISAMMLKYSMSREEVVPKVREVISTYDKDKNGALNFNEFLTHFERDVVKKTVKKTDEDVELITKFKGIDQNNDEKLSPAEIKGFLKLQGTSDSEASAYITDKLSKYDWDADGNINFREFKAANAKNDAQKKVSHENEDEEMRTKFKGIDQNNDGKLSPAEMKSFLSLQGVGDSEASEYITNKLSEHDRDADGSINFEEFKASASAKNDAQKKEVSQSVDEQKSDCELCGVAPSVQTRKSTSAPSKDIVDTAVGAGSFKTLVTAVTAADLVGVLKGEGPFTVFAPVDAAFAALPDGTVESLLQPDNKAQLSNVLTYHVLPGKVRSSDIAGKKLEVTMANGATAKIDATSGVKIGGANVIQADIETSNGVIHVIDAVILPPSPPSDCDLCGVAPSVRKSASAPTKKCDICDKSPPTPAPKCDICDKSPPTPAPKCDICEKSTPTPAPKCDICEKSTPAPAPKCDICEKSTPAPAPKCDICEKSTPKSKSAKCNICERRRS